MLQTGNLQKTRYRISRHVYCVFFSCYAKNSNKGGFNLVLLGQNVRVKVWFHNFIGDTEGNNKWLGQYPGNQERVQQPCWDCKRTFDSLKETNPTCVYITLQDVHRGKRRKQNDKDGGILYFNSVSRYDIDNAFLEKHLLLLITFMDHSKWCPLSSNTPLVADY